MSTDTAGAERALLGSAMRDARSMAWLAERLEAEDFSQREHQALFRLMVGRWKRGEGIDQVTLPEAVAMSGDPSRFGGLPYVVSLADEGSPAAAEHYMRHVVEGARLRKLHALRATLTELLADGSDADSITAEIGEALQQVAGSRERKPSTVVNCVQMALERVERWQEGSDMGKPLPTGLGALDAKLEGGLRSSRLVVIGARPGMGKTALGVQLAMGVVELAAAQDLAGVIISAEMAQIDVGARILAGYSGVPAHKLISGEPMETHEWDSVYVARKQVEALGHDRIYVDDRSSPTLEQISAVCHRQRAACGRLDVVVIDYFQILGISGRDYIRALNELSTGLLNLAKDLDTCVILLSQLNRNSTRGAMPDMSDLKGSGQLEQDAHTIILPYRPHYDDQRANPEDARLIVAKNRDGGTGTIDVRWVGSLMRFEDVADGGNFFG